MNWIRTPTGRNILLLSGAFVIPLGFAAAVAFGGLEVAEPVRLGIMLGAGAVAAWLVGAYWKGLDEAAREAQKSAGFWGGSFGTLAGLILLMLPFDLLPTAAETPRMLMVHGGMVVALCNVAGFFVAWAWWWWSRR